MDALSISAAAEEAPDRPFLVFDERTLSFADVARQVASTRAEPFVSFTATPTLQSIVTILAAFERHVAFCPLHPRWTDDDRARARERLQRPVEVQDLATVLFTSGTSGEPRGVLLRRSAWLASARAHAANLPFVAHDRWLLAMPLSHAGGLSIVTRALSSRTAVVVCPTPDDASILRAIGAHAVTLLSVVPAMLSRLLEHPRAEDLRLPRAILVGGAAYPPELRERARAAGATTLATYGLTETCSQLATQSPHDGNDPRNADSGKPLAGVEVRVGRGRIEVRGDIVMAGYLGAPPLEPGAWLDTGDEGDLDTAGRLTVFGRADDTIVTGGENVHPAEVERVLLSIAGVRAAAVFGVPDPTWGRLVAAALVLEPSIDPRSVLQAASNQLATFRRPRRFVVVDPLPTNANGKVSTKGLAAELGHRLETMSYAPR